MRNQIIAILISLFLCEALLVSANPAASVEEQRRDILNPDIFKWQKPFCAPVLCFVACMCGSHRDSRGCNTCSCLPCDGSGGEWAWA